MMNRDVLISGAGVAGPALAFWLHRFGFRPTIVERAAGLRTGGYAVDIRGAGLEVVERMGLVGELRRALTDTLATSFIDANGKRVATMDRGFGVIDPQDIEIMRGDLIHILYDATKGGTEYVFDDAITSIDSTDDGVRVTFERGAPRTFGLVVGADGIHSNVRRIVFGAEAPFLRHLGSSMAIFTAPNHLGLDRWQLMQMLPGRVATIKSDRGNAELKVTLFFASDAPRGDLRDVAEQRRLVGEAFAGHGWEMPRLLDAMRGAPDFYFDSTSQVCLERWSKGRVTLVGDAACGPSPLTGQGTSVALVGAYVLAGELAAATDHETALARYEAEARAFVERSQQTAVDVAKGFAPKTRFGAWFRNANLRILRYLPWKNLVMYLMMNGIRKAAKAIVLKDYVAADRGDERRAASGA